MNSDTSWQVLNMSTYRRHLDLSEVSTLGIKILIHRFNNVLHEVLLFLEKVLDR